jgi:propionyl-CoA carboxylase beta chain
VPVSIAGRTVDRTADRIADLEGRRIRAVAPAGPRRRGEYGARERIDLLLDTDSFTETGQFVRARPTEDAARRPYGDGVVTGHGTIDGRPVCVFAQDATVFGGSMGEAFGEKTIALMDLALKTGCPVIGLNDGGGARIQEGVTSLALYAELVRRNVRASGVIPQISVVLGPCAGGAAYSPAITDFTVMVEGTSHMFVTGPDVIETVTGERTSAEELGGARTSNAVNGNAHFLAADEVDALDTVRDLLSYLPANNAQRPPQYAPGAAPDGLGLDAVVPDRLAQAYDMRDVLRAVVDDGELLEGSRSCSRRTSSARWLSSRAPRSVSSPTSPSTRPVSSTSTPPRRPRGSYGSATRSASRC